MHYNRIQLERFRNETMPRFLRFLCELHLRRCRGCRERLNQLERDELLLTELRHSEEQLQLPGDDDATDRKSTE